MEDSALIRPSPCSCAGLQVLTRSQQAGVEVLLTYTNDFDKAEAMVRSRADGL